MSTQDLQQLKAAILMSQYLAYRGFQPIKRQGTKLLYYSPFRQEATPSFWVCERLNRFKDFGESDKGDDIISFIQRLDHCSFQQAVSQLINYAAMPSKTTFSFIGQSTVSQSDAPTEAIKAVKLIDNKALIRYAESRNIPYPLARKYLREVYYNHNGRTYFALGIGNDKEGFELRTKIGSYDVKRCIGSKAITTINGQIASGKAINLFEGFFDFLSALSYYKADCPNYTTIILNSTSLISEALPTLKQYGQINAYLDRDQTGQKVLAKLHEQGLPIVDRSTLYAGFNDFNEWWASNGNFRH